MAVASESYAPSVLISTEGLPEKEWLEYRRRGIGGSDAAAILGISPFATARDLYYDKLKIVPFDDSECNWVAKKMGHLLEDLVAEIFHVKTGYRMRLAAWKMAWTLRALVNSWVTPTSGRPCRRIFTRRWPIKSRPFRVYASCPLKVRAAV